MIEEPYDWVSLRDYIIKLVDELDETAALKGKISKITKPYMPGVVIEEKLK